METLNFFKLTPVVGSPILVNLFQVVMLQKVEYSSMYTVKFPDGSLSTISIANADNKQFVNAVLSRVKKNNVI